MVRDNWVEHGILDWGWGLLPGMSWKHERPLNEEEGIFANVSRKVRFAGLHEEIVTNQQDGSLVESNHGRADNITNPPQVEPLSRDSNPILGNVHFHVCNS
jgi:hypothetical protein